MRKLIPTILALVLPAAALASGDTVPNVNPRDLAMAGSAVAAQEGAPSVFGNPAALSRLRGLDVSLALNMLDNSTTWTSTTGLSPSPVSTEFHPAWPPALYAAYGGTVAGHGWGVGTGMTIVAGGNVNWDPSWPGNLEIVTVDRRVYGIFLTGGFELTKQIRLGGGAVYYRTTEYLSQGQNFLGSQGTADLSAAGGALSFDLSAEITPVEDFPLTVGVDYKHQGIQTLTGDARFLNVPPALRTALVDQGVTHVLPIPNSLNVGLAYRPSRPLLLTAGYTFDRYIVYNQDQFVGNGPLVGGQPLTVTVPRNYGNGSTYRVGAEYALSPQWTIRAGALRDESGMAVAVWSPSLPDGNVWAGSAGASYAIGWGVAVNAAVFYAHYDDVTTVQPDFPGKWQSSVWIFSLGASWHWDPQAIAQVQAQ